MVDISVRNKILHGVVIKEIVEPPFECLETNLSNKCFSDSQKILANFIAKYYCCPVGIAFNIFTPYTGKIDAKKSNVDSISKIKLSFLNNEQQQAIDFIANNKQMLLFGDTGSGKTEIYMHAILATIKQNKNVIFLMPEIALTPQMETRLKTIFGNLVFIWHSKINKKKNMFENIINSNIKIIVGARSALFLPIDDIGLIIIDEEHDDSYKSNSSPRYNARDLSIYLSTKSNAKLILGSATPNITTYFNFKKTNSIFRIKGSYFSSKKTIIFEESQTQITPKLVSQIKDTLRNKKQVIVFIGIRANFKTVICKNCGESIKCKQCSVTLSYHKKKNALLCHYCGYSEARITLCPYCNSDNLSAFKIGTQEVFEQLSYHINDANIAIFDRDEISSDKKLRKVLDDFNNQKIDILIGTQMISKGHDYHNVELVVVLGIDYLLRNIDYRAFEKSVSLLYQVSGRSGRKENGKVFIQTLNKSFFEQFKNYDEFLEFELKHREGSYPPFKRLALVITQNKLDSIAKERIYKCKHIVESNNKIEVVGVARAPIEKINGMWRYFMLLKSDYAKDLIGALHLIKNEQCIIDIDPIHFI